MQQKYFKNKKSCKYAKIMLDFMPWRCIIKTKVADLQQIKEANKVKVSVTKRYTFGEKKIVIAKCSHTGKFERAFGSMEALRKAWPGAEIVGIDEHKGFTVVYC